jgi:hypothetical protein
MIGRLKYLVLKVERVIDCDGWWDLPLGTLDVGLDALAFESVVSQDVWVPRHD